MADNNTKHKPKLKQVNKPYKPRGKSQPKKKSNGRSAPGPQVSTDWKHLNKIDRQHHATQKRKEARQKLLNKRRGLTQSEGDMQLEGNFLAPKVIGVLGMNGPADCERLKSKVLEHCEPTLNMAYKCPKWAPKHLEMQFVKVEREELDVLDWGKVLDMLVVVMSCVGADPSRAKMDPDTCCAFDQEGYKFMSALKTQGMPKVLGVIQDLDEVNPKKQKEVKKLFTRYFESEFPESKLIVGEDEQLARVVCNLAETLEEHPWRSNRSYLFSLNTQVNSQGELEVEGFLKGSGELNPNQLVHVTGFGDYQMLGIECMGSWVESTEPESLEAENEPGPFAAEQTWPTEEELAEAFSKLEVIPNDYETFYPEQDEEDDQIDLNETQQTIDLEERRPEDMDFPDEVDTPTQQKARERFQRYRGLASFRTSFWDPYENLPVDYSKLYEFKEPNHVVKKWSSEQCSKNSLTKQNSYVKLRIKNFPVQALSSYKSTLPLVVSSVLPQERKLSVLHYKLERWGDVESPVSSKQPLFFNCGFRRFQAKPIYSEDAINSDKFKYLKEFKDQGNVIASVYQTVMFPPANVLVYNDPSFSHLVATGSLNSFDPKRIIVKRILLTGYPLKIHKRKAVVRYMFFNPEDIKYFKPIELFTKNGLRGHILDSIGTHGHMKCVFSDFMKHGDIVCMPLYKRVFPIWEPLAWNSNHLPSNQ